MAHDQNSAQKVQPPARRGRGCMIWFGGMLAVLVVLLLAGSVYESLAEAADAQAYPPPGQMVDVGGYRLHLYCTGTGSPTVVLDTGLGDWSTMWAWVQPEVAKTTRMCTYDRAGSGWSDTGPMPRDAAQSAKELHTLLHQAGIPGPYVLVGHSLGGLTVRVFAGTYPSEVAGVVLIESMSPRQFTVTPPNTTVQPGAEPHVSSPFPALGQFGVARLLAGPLGLIPKLPPEQEKAYLSRMARPAYLQAYLGDESHGMPAAGVQANAVQSFGDIPLIVLTARLNTQPGWQDWQAGLLQLSSRSQQLFAEKSGHNVEIDQPDAATGAILKMVELLRQTAQK